MTSLTLIWIVFPFLVGFTIYLIPRLDRYLSLCGALFSMAYAAQLFANQAPLQLRLLDHFGVSLLLDPLTSFFILTNALVTAAVILYCWQSDKTTFFYAQTLILHGSVNAALACTDFISLYVALEVLSIASFLLIVYPRSDRSIWLGLRYLFISNVAILFYLVGAVLVYKAHHSFDFAGLRR
jgi:multicomponent Na+:H+ antiporter subunit D